jgi:hypothetical protein
MTPRFRSLLPPDASLVEFGTDERVDCLCCRAKDQAREQALFDPLPNGRSPLTPGIQLVNLSHSRDGRRRRADLGRDWARMFRQLSPVGVGWVTTQHEAAIVGRRTVYPALRVASGGGKGASGDRGDGGVWLDIRRFGVAHAVHLASKANHIFGVQFADESGCIVHRLTLTPESDWDEFFAWVRLHQSCTAHQPAPWREEEEESAPAELARPLRRCHASVLASILAACADRALPLRAIVRSRAVTQSVEFTPHSLRQNDPAAGWWYAFDDRPNFYCQPERFAQWVVAQTTSAGGEPRMAIRAVNAEGATVHVLEASAAAAENAWTELLETVA